MIKIPFPDVKNPQLSQTVNEILRRALDTTVVPIFVDQTGKFVNFGALSGQIDPFFVSVRAGFNKQVNFYDNVVIQRNLCVSDDATVSQLLQAGVIRSPVIIATQSLTANGPLTINGVGNSLTFPDGTSQTTSASSTATDTTARLLACLAFAAFGF